MCGAELLVAEWGTDTARFGTAARLSALDHRLAARRGKKRAIIAVAHSIVVSASHMLSRNEPYHE